MFNIDTIFKILKKVKSFKNQFNCQLGKYLPLFRKAPANVELLVYEKAIPRPTPLIFSPFSEHGLFSQSLSSFNIIFFFLFNCYFSHIQPSQLDLDDHKDGSKHRWTELKFE